MHASFGAVDWVRGLDHVTVGISDAALVADCDGGSGNVELRPRWQLVDARLGALLATEREVDSFLE